MTGEEITRNEMIKEARNIFADADKYDEKTLIEYVKLGQDVSKRLPQSCVIRLSGGKLALSKLLDVSQSIDNLTERERDIVDSFYGLRGKEKLIRFKIAKNHGIDKDRVSKILKNALTKVAAAYTSL